MQPLKSEPRLMDRMRDIIRLHQYSIATERVYLHWVRRFILFHGKRHPASMGKKEIELPWMDDVVRAKPKRRIPVVLSVAEVALLLQNCRITQQLPASMLLGAGLRLMVCVRLRVERRLQHLVR